MTGFSLPYYVQYFNEWHVRIFEDENENDPFVLRDTIVDVMSTLQEQVQGCIQNFVEHLRCSFFRGLPGFWMRLCNLPHCPRKHVFLRFSPNFHNVLFSSTLLGATSKWLDEKLALFTDNQIELNFDKYHQIYYIGFPWEPYIISLI